MNSHQGRKGVKIIVGKKSGRSNVEYYLKKLKMKVDEKAVETILKAVKDESLKLKKPISTRRFKIIVNKLAKSSYG